MGFTYLYQLSPNACFNHNNSQGALLPRFCDHLVLMDAHVPGCAFTHVSMTGEGIAQNGDWILLVFFSKYLQQMNITSYVSSAITLIFQKFY